MSNGSWCYLGLAVLMKWDDKNQLCHGRIWNMRNEHQYRHRHSIIMAHYDYGCQERILQQTRTQWTHRAMVLINTDDRVYWYWIYMRKIVPHYIAIPSTRHGIGIQQITQNLCLNGSWHHFYRCSSSEQRWYTSILSVMTYNGPLSTDLCHTDGVRHGMATNCTALSKPKVESIRANKGCNITYINAVRMSNGSMLLYYHYQV